MRREVHERCGGEAVVRFASALVWEAGQYAAGTGTAKVGFKTSREDMTRAEKVLTAKQFRPMLQFGLLGSTDGTRR